MAVARRKSPGSPVPGRAKTLLKHVRHNRHFQIATVHVVCMPCWRQICRSVVIPRRPMYPLSPAAAAAQTRTRRRCQKRRKTSKGRTFWFQVQLRPVHPLSSLGLRCFRGFSNHTWPEQPTNNYNTTCVYRPPRKLFLIALYNLGKINAKKHAQFIQFRNFRRILRSIT